MREGRGDVVRGLGELPVPDVRRVHQHLEHRGAGLTRRRRRGVHLLGEDVQPAAVVQRDAEHVGDDVGRELAGDVVDEVALAALDDGVDDLLGELGDASAVGLRLVGLERVADEPPVAVVLRRVLEQHHLPHRAEALLGDVVQVDAALLVGERAVVTSDRADVGVLGDRPEVALRTCVPVDGVVLAQPREGVVRLSAVEGLRVDEVDLRTRVRAHPRDFSSAAETSFTSTSRCEGLTR